MQTVLKPFIKIDTLHRVGENELNGVRNSTEGREAQERTMWAKVSNREEKGPSHKQNETLSSTLCQLF